MPGFDGTGPAGAGKSMGREMGPCGQDGSMDPAGSLGRGMGFGKGFGPGFGPGLRVFRADGSETGEEGLKAVLSEKKNYLKARLDAIDKRLETL